MTILRDMSVIIFWVAAFAVCTCHALAEAPSVCDSERVSSTETLDIPSASISAKIPFYQTNGARNHYVGDADSDFTQRMSDYWKLLTGGTLMDMAHLYWHSEDISMPMHDARALEAAEGLSKREFFHKVRSGVRLRGQIEGSG